MLFGGLQKTTLVDYPGKVAATVFTIGCNFRCPYCHNPELVLPELSKKQPKIPEKDFFNFLKEKKGLLEGVTICGGEPCINKDLPQFCQKIKKLGYLVKLDTNGSNPGMLEGLIKEKLIDYVAMDIKAPKEKYHLFTQGIDFISQIEKSIQILKNNQIDYEFRTTLIPEVLEERDILNIVEWIKPTPRFFLQRFKNDKVLDKEFKNIQAWSEQRTRALLKKIKPYFSECNIR